MSNWFIGLPVDPKGWYPERVPSPPAGIRPFPAEDLHLTIAFLGNVGEERARGAWDGLSWPLGPVEAELAELIPMGSPRRYSALSFLLDRGRAEIERAMAIVRDPLLALARARPEERPPKAHLTIARPAKNATESQRRDGLAWAETVDLRGTPILLDRVALYTWSDDRKERLFRVVAEHSTISSSPR